MQVENLARELSTTGDLHTQLTAKVHDLEKENLVLKNRADEVRLKPQFTRDVFSHLMTYLHCGIRTRIPNPFL